MANKKTRQSGGRRGITAISVEGFKSIKDKQRIELRPLTILAGANSSGKSSVMQPLLLMKQTLEAAYDPGALLLDGANVQFTSAEQILWKPSGGEAANSFAVDLELSDEKLALRFDKASGGRLDVQTSTYAVGTKVIAKLYRGMPSEELQRALPAELRPLFVSSQKRERKLSVVRRRCFLALAVEGPGLDAPMIFDVSPMAIPFFGFSEAPEALESLIERVIHVPGLRGNPERTYKTSAVGDKFQGRFNDYVASVISHWQEKDSGEIHLLGESLEHLGLTWKVEARQMDAARAEIRVGRLAHGRRGGARDLVSIADVGFGLSQTLPVVVALLVARPDHLVYLEQPEIHLHPRAQSRMAALLAGAAKRGVTVVAETHSSLLLRGIQTLVAKGEVAADLVKLHWFKRVADGSTQVFSADLDEAGGFGEGWPEDFDEVALEAESEYLDAAGSRQ